jgi:hypothetical protein
MNKYLEKIAGRVAEAYADSGGHGYDTSKIEETFKRRANKGTLNPFKRNAVSNRAAYLGHAMVDNHILKKVLPALAKAKRLI